MSLIIRRCLITSEKIRRSLPSLNSLLHNTNAYDSFSVKNFSQVAKPEKKNEVGAAMPVGETIKTSSYLAVILLGIGVTGVIGFTILRELFSRNSPQAIYANALERCKSNNQVQDLLGQPIKGFGEESTRRRRNHVAHQVYFKGERKYMRLSFHIQGIRNKATVHCEMKENESGDYDFRYLFIQTDSYPHATVIIEDNRADNLESEDSSSMPQTL